MKKFFLTKNKYILCKKNAFSNNKLNAGLVCCDLRFACLKIQDKIFGCFFNVFLQKFSKNFLNRKFPAIKQHNFDTNKCYLQSTNFSVQIFLVQIVLKTTISFDSYIFCQLNLLFHQNSGIELWTKQTEFNKIKVNSTFLLTKQTKHQIDVISYDVIRFKLNLSNHI